jgi:hypothetical protein
MAGLAAARKILQMGVIPEVMPSFLDAEMKANAKLWVGGMAAVDSSGYFVDPTATTALFLAGIVQPKAGYPQVYDNTGGANGAIVARVQEGVFSFLSGGGGDALTIANRYQPVFVMDDQTVGATDGGATPRSLAGILMDIDSSSNPQVLVCAGINAAILAAARVGAAAAVIDTIAAAGALSLAGTTLWSITGTQVLTLANGTQVGQKKKVLVVASASTPVGSIVVATPQGFATLTAISGITTFLDFLWTGSAWLLAAHGGTISIA